LTLPSLLLGSEEAGYMIIIVRSEPAQLKFASKVAC